MGGNSSDKTTTVQKADPWKGAQPYLHEALGQAHSLFNQGLLSPTPYQGQRVAGFNPMQNQSHQMIQQQAMGPQLAQTGSSTLGQMMDGGWQSGQLDAVKNEALGSAVPAAVSQFAGSGMANSSQAMDTVGRAATSAVAPFEYDAFNQMQDRSLKAAGLSPMMDAAGYLPGQMLGQVGAEQQGLQQANIDANISRFYENQNQYRDELGAYSDMILGYGGLGGTQTGSHTAPGVGFGQKAGGAALGGLGTYGALAMNPATAPFAMLGGLGAGLLGLF